MNQLTLSRIEKSFGPVPVIKGIDLEVSEGEFVVFIGPSGCGKSTLLRMIAGLDDTTTGDILINGRRVNDLPPVSRGIAMVFQSYALYPHMSVFENIAFPLRVEGLAKSEVTARVEDAARVLQLDTRLQQKPGTLSGGQRQRVAIGRAIVRKPKIFLFDEPLSNLDASLRGEMRIELSRLHKVLGTTMIYVTHDQVEAMTMADKIVVLNGGLIEQVGTPLELYNRPVNTFVAGFIGNPRMNFLTGTCTAVGAGTTDVTADLVGPVRLPFAVSQGLVGQSVILGVRPEHLGLADPAGHDSAVPLTAAVVERLGLQTLVHHAVDGEAKMFSCLFPGDAPISAGDRFGVRLDPEKCMLFDSGGVRHGD